MLRITVILGLLAGFALSPKLWLGPRFYPLSPVGSFFNPLDRLAFIALACLLIALIFVPRRAIFIAVFALLVLVALQDQSRWQPWFYQYVLMLLAIALAGPGRQDAARNTCWLIVALTYLWSGLAKFNPGFAVNVWPLLTPPAFHGLSIAAPILECAAGIGLLTVRFRKASALCAVVMHVFILIAIGPFGARFNSVVWPWNLAMIAFLCLLFSNEPVWGTPFVYQKVAFVLFAVMPALSLANLWDHDLSSSMYSGNRTFGTIYFNDSVFDRLPDAIQDFVTDEGPDRGGLDVNEWSVGELNVPSYPEPRIYRNVFRTICRYGANDPGIELIVEEQLALIHGGGRGVYRCTQR